jgi:hypothetical protein
MSVCTSTRYSSVIRRFNWKLEVLCFDFCSMRSTLWASYWLIYVTNSSTVVAKWHSYWPRLLFWHVCPNQMWATGIMKQLLFATSVVLAWFSQSDASNRYHEDTGEWPPRHVCCLGMIAPIRFEQQGPTDSYSASMDEHLPKSHYVLA